MVSHPTLKSKVTSGLANFIHDGLLNSLNVKRIWLDGQPNIPTK